ncbi:MAG: serine hydrolase [Bacteroidales bacterium]|nr:serine hydrolase [Bacteroidales bacterium]MCF8456165.1 serine hydrolase [Bacteroidales bacterium]
MFKRIDLFALLFGAIFLSFQLIPTKTPPAENPRHDRLDVYFQKALADWEVPGMAIGIVKNDTLIFAKGYGVREIGKPEKVDANSMFAIASNTKSFTSAAIAILVEEGKLSWDDKVIKYLPYFELYDPWVTANMTIRDLLCHRSGLETFSGDLVWYGTTYSREEVVKRAKYLEPAYPFRTHFGYQNIMFIAAGEIVSKVSGMTWDEFLKERFFSPLEMNRTTTTINDFARLGNVAMPHTSDQGKTISIPYMNWDNIGGAGAINSCVNDVSKWLMLQLNKGTFNGKEIFNKESSHEMWTPHTIQDVSLGAERVWPSTHFKSYGLGWSLFDYHGRKIVGHGGGYDGVLSYTCMVPEENLGFVILTNKNSTLYYSLIYKILDTFLSDDKTDWSGKFLARTKTMEKMGEEEKLKKEEARIKKTKPSLDLIDYTGTYTSELYGDVEVKLENKKLMLYFIPTPDFVGVLGLWHFDTFSIKLKNTPSLPEGTAQFILNEKGKAHELRIDIPNPDFYFTELKLFKKE